MQNLTISLSENILKVSTVESKEFKGVSAEVSKDVVDDYKILNNETFSVALKELITAVTGKNPRSLSLSVVVEPNDMIFKFVTVNKGGGEIEDQIINEIKSKVKEFPLEEIYFSYRKIAPFVYQFIGVKKETIDSYIEVANLTGIGLKSAVSWMSLLPRFTNTNEPSIYITKAAGKQVVALSEFNGIFYSGVYEKDKSAKELQKAVQELSVYKRTEPISKVYIYNYENFSLNPEYQILNLEIPNSDLEEAKGYEMHLLLGYMVEKDKDILTTQTNLLNLLPVPVVQKEKNMALVYAGGASLVLLVALLIGGAILLNKNRGRSQEVLESTAQNTEVLSEDATSREDQMQEEEVIKEQPVELNREDLTVRIENGAGIPGIAGRTQTFLEEFGYVVESVGNADVTGSNQTVIKMKPKKAAYQDLLKQDMADDFDVVIEEDLAEDAAYDALIVVGLDAQI